MQIPRREGFGLILGKSYPLFEQRRIITSGEELSRTNERDYLLRLGDKSQPVYSYEQNNAALQACASRACFNEGTLRLFTGLPFEEYNLDIRIATGAGTEILTKTIIAISPKHLDVNDDIHG